MNVKLYWICNWLHPEGIRQDASSSSEQTLLLLHTKHADLRYNQIRYCSWMWSTDYSEVVAMLHDIVAGNELRVYKKINDHVVVQDMSLHWWQQRWTQKQKRRITLREA